MSQPGTPPPRRVIWVAGSRAELKALPPAVRRTMGIAIWFAQQGRAHPAATGMRGPLSGVMEVRVEAGSGTFRLMYTARIGDTIHVLAAFQKKSHEGAATPKHLLDRIAHRLAMARQCHQSRP